MRKTVIVHPRKNKRKENSENTIALLIIGRWEILPKTSRDTSEH